MSIAFIFELNQEKSMTNENPLCIDLNESGLKRETIWRVYLFPGQVSHKWSSTVLMEIKTSSTNIGAKRLMKLPSLILNLIKLVRRGKPPHPVFPHPRVFELTDRVRHCSLIKRIRFKARRLTDIYRGYFWIYWDEKEYSILRNYSVDWNFQSNWLVLYPNPNTRYWIWTIELTRSISKSSYPNNIDKKKNLYSISLILLKTSAHKKSEANNKRQ